MQKISTLLLASSLLMSTATLVNAEPAPAGGAEAHAHKPHGPKAYGLGGPTGILMHGIVLTEAQQKQLRTILEEGLRPPLPTDQEREATYSLITAEKFDADKANTLVDNQAKMQKERMLDRLHKDNKIYNMLTPEQKKQYQSNYVKVKQPRHSAS